MSLLKKHHKSESQSLFRLDHLTKQSEFADPNCLELMTGPLEETAIPSGSTTNRLNGNGKSGVLKFSLFSRQPSVLSSNLWGSSFGKTRSIGSAQTFRTRSWGLSSRDKRGEEAMRKFYGTQDILDHPKFDCLSGKPNLKKNEEKITPSKRKDSAETRPASKEKQKTMKTCQSFVTVDDSTKWSRSQAFRLYDKELLLLRLQDKEKKEEVKNELIEKFHKWKKTPIRFCESDREKLRVFLKNDFFMNRELQKEKDKREASQSIPEDKKVAKGSLLDNEPEEKNEVVSPFEENQGKPEKKENYLSSSVFDKSTGLHRSFYSAEKERAPFTSCLRKEETVFSLLRVQKKIIEPFKEENLRKYRNEAELRADDHKLIISKRPCSFQLAPTKTLSSFSVNKVIKRHKDLKKPEENPKKLIPNFKMLSSNDLPPSRKERSGERTFTRKIQKQRTKILERTMSKISFSIDCAPRRPKNSIFDKSYQRNRAEIRSMRCQRVAKAFRNCQSKLKRCNIPFRDQIKFKIFPNQPFEKPNSYEFIKNVKKNNLEEVQRMIGTSEKPLVYEFDHVGQTGLHWAAKRGLKAMTRLLIEANCDVDSRNMVSSCSMARF